jgi:PAS domain S-box-containing protein
MERRADGIWIIDGNANTSYANERMAEILKTSSAAMIGKPSFDYLFADDVGDAQKLFESKARGSTKPFSFKLRCADGSSIWVEVQGTPMHNAGGEFVGIVGTFTEVDPPTGA